MQNILTLTVAKALEILYTPKLTVPMVSNPCWAEFAPDDTHNDSCS